MNKLHSLILLTLLSLSLLTSISLPIALGDTAIITVYPFNLAFATGESFNVQDTIRGAFINFTVTSGTLTATGILNVNSTSGEIIVTNTLDCIIAVDYNFSQLSVTVNDAVFSRFVTMTPGGVYSIKWVSATPAIIVNTGGQTYYFRSDQYTTNNYTAYGFDSSYTNTNTTLSIATSASTVTYGYQVWILHFDGSTTELTNGAPTATFTLTSGSNGWQTTTWNCPGQGLILGYDAIKIGILASTDSGATWTTMANFVSPVIISNTLNPTTWTFNMYATYDGSQSTIQFGNANFKSNIQGIQFVKPLQSDVALWRLSRGDWLGWLLGEYVDQMTGAGFYGLLLFGVCATLYYRYKNSGVILFFFAAVIMQGGFWFLLPVWAASVAGALLILIGAFLMWRLLR